MLTDQQVKQLARKRFKCHNCNGFVEFRLDEFRYAMGTCIICGHETVQKQMSLAEIERLSGSGSRSKER